MDEETGLYYFGARYYDPVVSQWVSTDPPMSTGEYFPTGKQLFFPEEKFDHRSLPGIGGVYNSVNLNVYHYAGQNPVKLVDPDGNELFWYSSLNLDFGRDYATEGAQAFNNNQYGYSAACFLSAGIEGTVNSALFVNVAEAAISKLNVAITGGGAPLAKEISKDLDLTTSQGKNINKVLEIAHNWSARKTLSGNNLDAGHINKLKDGMAGLIKSRDSLLNSLKNPNLSESARNVLMDTIKLSNSLIDQADKLTKGK